ncbi:hypothetical protein RR46_01005 [Papilio xuthus]|uniref:Uncharacterized protein n=1 Tax=Papilio xuthus TaxID=66420 RepID=A0A0N1IN90_PAPXU|nr:hypothetical protein RR46_01005 [Papilio xuthus]
MAEKYEKTSKHQQRFSGTSKQPSPNTKAIPAYRQLQGSSRTEHITISKDTNASVPLVLLMSMGVDKHLGVPAARLSLTDQRDYMGRGHDDGNPVRFTSNGVKICVGGVCINSKRQDKRVRGLKHSKPPRNREEEPVRQSKGIGERGILIRFPKSKGEQEEYADVGDEK